jgi:hypothetical protein
MNGDLRRAFDVSCCLVLTDQRATDVKPEPSFRSPTYPYVAPHTTKIHTPITLGNVTQTAPGETIAESLNWNIELEHCL